MTARGIVAAGRGISCTAVLFDKGGTLLDFRASWFGFIRAWTQAIVRARPVGPDLEAALCRCQGFDSATEMMDPRGPMAIAPREHLVILQAGELYARGVPWDEAVETVAAAQRETEQALPISQRARAVPGVVAAVRRLAEAGLKLAVVSSDTEQSLLEGLAVVGLAGCFSAVVGVEEVQAAKPSPEALIVACERLGVSPGDAVMVGDAASDMRAGKRAGVACCIGVVEGGVSDENSLAPYADVVFPSAAHISPWVP